MPSMSPLRTSSLRKRRRGSTAICKGNGMKPISARASKSKRRKKSNRSTAADNVAKSCKEARDSQTSQEQRTPATPTPHPTVVLISPYAYTPPCSRKQGSTAFWRTKGELLDIAQNFGGLAIQYRAKYHEGKPVKDSAPQPGTTLKGRKSLAPSLIQPGALIIQSRFVSSSGCHGGSSFSFKKFRLPGNLRRHTRCSSIYKSTRPSLVIPEKVDDCPLFVIDKLLSEHDRNVVRTFISESSPGFSPSQVIIDIDKENKRFVTTLSQKCEVVGEITHDLECLQREIKSNDLDQLEHRSSYINDKKSDDISTPILLPTFSKSSSESRSKAESSSNNSHTLMETTIFVPSQPRHDAKPTRSILRRQVEGNESTDAGIISISTEGKRSYSKYPQNLNNCITGFNFHERQSERQETKADPRHVVTPCITSREEKANHSATLVGNLRNRAHLLKRKLNSPTPSIEPKQKAKHCRINYGKQNRICNRQAKFTVENSGLYFAFIEGIEETTLSGEVGNPSINGRIIELPGEVLLGEWTVTYQSNRNAIAKPFEINAKFFYRNEHRSLPSLSSRKLDDEGITISTIQTSINREENIFEQQLLDQTDLLSQLSCSSLIKSLTIATFNGFDSASDYLQRCNQVTKTILEGIQSESSVSSKNMGFLPVLDRNKASSIIGSAFLCKLILKSSITIHIAQDELSGHIVALDVVLGMDSSTSETSSDISENRCYLSEATLKKFQEALTIDTETRSNHNAIDISDNKIDSIRSHHPQYLNSSLASNVDNAKAKDARIAKSSNSRNKNESNSIESISSNQVVDANKSGYNSTNSEHDDQSKIEPSVSHMSLGASTILNIATERAREIRNQWDDESGSSDLGFSNSQPENQSDDQCHETISCITDLLLKKSKIDSNISDNHYDKRMIDDSDTGHLKNNGNEQIYYENSIESNINEAIPERLHLSTQAPAKDATLQRISHEIIFENNVFVTSPEIFRSTFARSNEVIQQNYSTPQQEINTKDSLSDNETFFSLSQYSNEEESCYQKKRLGANLCSVEHSFHNVFYGCHDFQEHELTLLKEGEIIEPLYLVQPTIPTLFSSFLGLFFYTGEDNDELLLTYHDVFYGVQDESGIESTWLLPDETTDDIDFGKFASLTQSHFMTILQNCLIGPDHDDNDADNDNDENYHDWNPLHDVFFGFCDTNEDNESFDFDEIQVIVNSTDDYRNFSRWPLLNTLFASLEDFLLPNI